MSLRRPDPEHAQAARRREPLGWLTPAAAGLALVATAWSMLRGEIARASTGGLAPGTILRLGCFLAAVGTVLALLARYRARLTEALAETRARDLALRAALSEVERAEEGVKRLAHLDPLTGLPNRTLFGDRLSLAITQARRDRTRLAVLFVDLDHFKDVNDSLGHATGDRLLRGVAERLQACVRAGDTVARLGGDEFVVLLPGLEGEADAMRVGEKVLGSLRRPFTLAGQEVFLTASSGISLYPESGPSAVDLVNRADTAMYRAKAGGRNRQVLYTPAMGAGAAESLALEHGLHKALAARELVLHYEPILDLQSGRIHGVEALLRWRHPELGLIWPEDFVPLAEATGLMLPIGEWALETACAQVLAWHRQGFPQLRLAMNLSSVQLRHPDLVGQVVRTLGETGLHARFLELELTEHRAMQDAERALATLEGLKAFGITLCLDDFGRGYSSFSHLKGFPLDALKLDPVLLRDIETDREAAAVAGAVIAMAHSLRLRVTAEGVETPDQHEFLASRGCDLLQGYLLGHPLPAEQCIEFLQESRAGVESRARLLPWVGRA
jgi:diguanylate cyclase (GGDEF)-like protein